MIRFTPSTRAALTATTFLAGLLLFSTAGHTTVISQTIESPVVTNRDFSNVVAAQSSPVGEGALAFVKSTAEKGIEFITRPNTTQAQKKQEFRKLLDAHFDLDTIGRFALGSNWNRATKQEQAEYMRLFKQMVVNVYSDRFGEYKGQKFEARTFRPIGNNDTLVSSYLVPTDGGQEVQVDWRVRHSNGRYKVVDVMVAGVSMSVTQRSDFNSVIQRGGGQISALITELKNGRGATIEN